MTDKAKLEEIKKLADAMYYAAFNLTTDASLLRKAMNEYRQFVIHKYCKEEPVSIWHDSREEPNDKSSCLIHYIVGGEVSYRDIFPVLYNKEAREFVSEPYPHPTGYNVEQSSLEGGVVAEVYKDMRDRFPISDIYKWAYVDDILNLSNVERTGKNWKEEQLMAKAIDVTVHMDAGGYPYIPQMELYDYDKDIPLAKEGDKYKVVLIKEE